MRIRHAIAVAALVLGAALAAPAQMAAGPCTTDVQALCPHAGRGGARFRCLLDHESELSPACRDHLKQRQAQRSARRAQVRAACREEIDRWCAIATPGEGGMLGCLRRKADELSPACREALPERGAAP